MGDDSVRIPLQLIPHDLKRLTQALASEELPASIDDDALVIPDEALGLRVYAWCKRLTWLNRDIHRIAAREGKPLQPYKPFDPVNLYLAVLSGLHQGSLHSLAHEVIWRQPFRNANHRSTTAALLEEMDLDPNLEELAELTEPLFKRSKELMDGSDQSLSNDEAKAEHLATMEKLVEALQSIK